MSTWPHLSTVVRCWGVLTLAGIAALLCVMRQQPPDAEPMFAGFSGQLLLATIEVGVPSLLGLWLFLLIGALLKRHLLR